jgi:hypothetical protein
MAYLKTSDYSLRISVTNLDEILSEAATNTGLTTDNIRTNAESWAQAIISSYLSNKYDMATEFAYDAVDDEALRDRQIMQNMIDLVLCTVHKTINPRDLPDHVSNGCDAAMQWLKDVRDGLLILPIDERPLAEGEVEYDTTWLSSQPKFISKPFTDGKILDNE